MAPDWHTFENFILDMGIPDLGMVLDRIDNNGNYCKSNCRYVSPGESARNRRSTKWLTAFGETLCQKDMCKKYFISAQAFYYRTRVGMSVEEALTAPNKRIKKCQTNR